MSRSPSARPPAEHSENESGGFLQNWLPHPLLTLFLVAMWAALVGKLSGGNVLMGAVLGILIPIYTGNFWPDRPIIRSPLKAVVLLVIVVWDVLVANILVAWIILFRPISRMRNQWIAVPLELESPEAITALAATITLTPGTVTSDLAADGRTLLVHCLDVADPVAEVQRIKHRYERRIKEIFP